MFEIVKQQKTDGFSIFTISMILFFGQNFILNLDSEQNLSDTQRGQEKHIKHTIWEPVSPQFRMGFFHLKGTFHCEQDQHNRNLVSFQTFGWNAN